MADSTTDRLRHRIDGAVSDHVPSDSYRESALARCPAWRDVHRTSLRHRQNSPSVYLGKAAVGSSYGASGSFVVILVWAYWSAQIFFFGLEITHVSAGKDAAAKSLPRRVA